MDKKSLHLFGPGDSQYGSADRTLICISRQACKSFFYQPPTPIPLPGFSPAAKSLPGSDSFRTRISKKNDRVGEVGKGFMPSIHTWLCHMLLASVVDFGLVVWVVWV